MADYDRQNAAGLSDPDSLTDTSQLDRLKEERRMSLNREYETTMDLGNSDSFYRNIVICRTEEKFDSITHLETNASYIETEAPSFDVDDSLMVNVLDEWESKVCWDVSLDPINTGTLKRKRNCPFPMPLNHHLQTGSWINYIINENKPIDMPLILDLNDPDIYLYTYALQPNSNTFSKLPVIIPRKRLRPSDVSFWSDCVDNDNQEIAVSNSFAIMKTTLSRSQSINTFDTGPYSFESSRQMLADVRRREEDKEKRIALAKARLEAKQKQLTKLQQSGKAGEDVAEQVELQTKQLNQIASGLNQVSHKIRSLLVPTVDHSYVSVKHKGVAIAMKQSDKRNFHRPRMDAETRLRPTKHKEMRKTCWTLSLVGNEMEPVSSSARRSNRASSSTFVKESDLSLHDGSDFILIEFIEENPLLVSNIGMASRIINYTRSRELASRTGAKLDDDDADGLMKRKNKFGSNDPSAVNDDDNRGETFEATIERIANDIYLNNNAEKDRFYVIDNADDCVLKQIYGANAFSSKNLKSASSSTSRNVPLFQSKIEERIVSDALSLTNKHTVTSHGPESIQVEGQVVLLQSEDQSPLLGDCPDWKNGDLIDAGSFLTCLSTNMYRSALYEHSSQGLRHVDYLLCLKQKNVLSKVSDVLFVELEWVVRPIRRLYLSGQVEPQINVPQPSKKMTEFQKNLFSFALSKYLLEFDEVKFSHIKALFADCNLSDSQIKSLLAINASQTDHPVSQHAAVPSTWIRKEDDEFIPPDEWSQKFTPEDVAAYQSSLAGQQRLSDCGIEDFRDVPKIFSLFLCFKTYSERRRDWLNWAQKIAFEQRESVGGPKLESLVKILESMNNRASLQRSILRCMYDELMRSPWFLATSFVETHLQNQGTGMMLLSGHGDPSGIGEGFSYIPITRQRNKRGEASKKTTKGLAKTSADLRKITLEDQIRMLEDHGMNRDDILALKRHDRNAIIREIANKSKNSSSGSEIEKYSRVEKVSLQRQLIDYKRRVSDISAFVSSRLLRRNYSQEQKDMENRANRFIASSAMSFATPAKEEVDIWQELEDEIDETAPVGNASSSSSIIPRKEMTEKETKRLEEKRFMEAALASLETKIKMQKINEAKIQRLAQANMFPNVPMLMSSPSFVFQGTNSNFAFSQSLASTSRLDGMDQSSMLASTTRVVKRITRRLTIDGHESIFIEFLHGRKEVERVLDHLSHMKEEYEVKLARYRKRLQEELENEISIAEGDFHYKDIQLKLSSKAIRESIENPSNRLNVNMVELKKSTKRHEKRNEVRSEMRHKNRKLGNWRGQTKRLPHVELAAYLDKILIPLSQDKKYAAFRDLVDRSVFPNYYETIKNPICLNSINKKICDFEYRSYSEFLRDMSVIAQNAKQFNGPTHELTIAADNLLQSAQVQVGIDIDVYGWLDVKIKEFSVRMGEGTIV